MQAVEADGKWWGRKVLVTGGAGFIGINLCKELAMRGAEVTAVDDFSAHSLIERETVKRELAVYGVELRVCPMLDLIGTPGKWDVWFNLACRKKNAGGLVSFSNYMREHVLNLDLLVKDLVLNERVSTIVYASTGSVWEGHFMDDLVICGAELPSPLSDYAISKLAGERVMRRMASKVPVKVLRLFNVVGPWQDYGEHGGFLARWCWHAYKGLALPIYGDGSQVRTLTWVGDVVDAMIAAADDSNVLTTNVASGNWASLWQVAEHIRTLCAERLS